MSRGEDTQLSLLLQQWANRADRTGRPVPGRFLTGDEFTQARRQARESGVIACFDGGYDDAERRQVCFCPFDEEAVYTLQWISICWNSRFARVTHSDLLGSLMALGIDRMYYGDLICSDSGAWLAALPEAARQLPDMWTKAGNTPIRVSVLEKPPHIAPPKGVSMRDTIPSPRLDCILSSGMRQSRARAAQLIREGLVSVDHEVETRCDRQLHAGQLLSVRHFGRIRIRDIGSPTRKDRLPVELELFTRK